MAVFASTYSAPHRGGFLRWIVGSVVLLFLTGLLSLLSQLSQTPPASCVGPQCRVPPPQHGQLSAPAVYTSSRYGFSVEYSTAGVAPSQTAASSISWDGMLSDGSEVSWTIVGGPSKGRSPQQIVNSLQTGNFPDAQFVYAIPGAAIGYTSGYGAVYDLSASPANGQAVHDRVVIMVGIRRSLAVAVAGVGPYQRSTPSDGHPNPADTPLVDLGDFEESTNSVTWPGESPL